MKRTLFKHRKKLAHCSFELASTSRHVSMSSQGIFVKIRPQPAETSESVLILTFLEIPDIDLFWHMRCSSSLETRHEPGGSRHRVIEPITRAEQQRSDEPSRVPAENVCFETGKQEHVACNAHQIR